MKYTPCVHCNRHLRYAWCMHCICYTCCAHYTPLMYYMRYACSTQCLADTHGTGCITSTARRKMFYIKCNLRLAYMRCCAILSEHDAMCAFHALRAHTSARTSWQVLLGLLLGGHALLLLIRHNKCSYTTHMYAHTPNDPAEGVCIAFVECYRR